jgi:hypothetical protein
LKGTIKFCWTINFKVISRFVRSRSIAFEMIKQTNLPSRESVEYWVECK